jgi:hypothetical protein
MDPGSATAADGAPAAKKARPDSGAAAAAAQGGGAAAAPAGQGPAGPTASKAGRGTLTLEEVGVVPRLHARSLAAAAV